MSQQTATTTILHSLEKLRGYIEQSAYKGYDPYDGLMSPLFRLPILKSSHQLRFYAQQFIKRAPVNLRPLLGIRKNINPVTLGLCLQGYTAQTESGAASDQSCLEILSKLKEAAASGFHGSCWGYDFHWEARYARIPAYQPTVVATGIISNALYKHYLRTGNSDAKAMLISAADFVLNDLYRTNDENGNICFSYSPFDRQVVFNASLKGARLLSQAGSILENKEMTETALLAVRYVATRQRADGSWTYADSKGGWTDNYHTGYVLDCLEEAGRLAGTNEFEAIINKGFEYYKSTFFIDRRIPKFYNQSLFPVDCTAAAQSILTLIRFGEIEMAKNVAVYMAENMQSEKGYFYFRKYRFHTEKTPFMRWSDAWMFAALSELTARTGSGGK